MKTVNVYSINELSQEAKEKAIREYRHINTEIFWADETSKSLISLFDCCNNITLKDYSLGDACSWISVSFPYNEGEFYGKRAFAWIENNLLSNIRISDAPLSIKTSQRRKLAQYGRYYRAGMIKPGPFTGCYADDDFLESLLTDIREGADLQTAFEGLATKYQEIINAEIEYQNSEEYIIEHMEANEYEFLKDGTRI